MSNNICKNVAYLNSIDQKRRFQLLNVPPVRYDNLATNPYNQINPTTGSKITKNDLDMRRKTEILKYSSNRMSTQTNNLTKAQLYTQAITGSYKTRTYSQTYLNQNTTNGVLNSCPLVMTSTTSSDVPGPPILLYSDPNVPLYNLVNDADVSAFGIINQDVNVYTRVWNNTIPVDVYNRTGNSTITSIYILHPTTPSLMFNITTPVSINLTGNLSEGGSYNASNAVTVTMKAINLNVNYSFSSVPSKSATIAFNNPPQITLDISMNKGNPTYSASCYLGLLTISNLILPVQTGFIYDIQVGIVYSVNAIDSYNAKCNLPTTSSYIDTSYTQSIKKTINCTVHGDVNIPSPFPVLQISTF